MKTLIETKLATLERVSPELMVIRFKPGVRLDLQGISDVLQERKRLCTGEPYSVLTVLAPDSDFDLDVMTKDHYHGLGLDNCTRAIAFAANDVLNERMASLYFAYFPQRFGTRVFMEEEEARAWLLQEVASRSMN